MTAQFREDIGPLQGSCTGLSVWIVGSGPSLDGIDLGRLSGRYIFALNGAIELFKDAHRFPDAWWIWWDMRAYHEIWPRISDWARVQSIIHKKGLEEMRSHKGAGRYICYVRQSFVPKRSVVETGLLLADFAGFDRAYLVGVDGFVAEGARPYAKALDWKRCHFMDRGRPGSHVKSSMQMVSVMRDLKRRLPRIQVIQTSPTYPDLESFESLSFDEAIEQDGRPKKHRRGRQGIR